MSEYLDSPTRSLEQLRDDLWIDIGIANNAMLAIDCPSFARRHWREFRDRTRARLAAVEAEIATRGKS